MQELPKRKVGAVFSMPRLAFTDNLLTASRVFHRLGIPIQKHCGAYWDQTIQMAFQRMVAEKFDYVITVDYDSLFDTMQVLELLRLIEKTGADAIFPMQVKRTSPSLMFHCHPFDQYNPESELTRALTGHFGLTAIRVAALSKIPLPWFWSVPSEQGEWVEGSGKADADISFWKAADHYKWMVYQANWVRIGHMETMISWPMPDGTVDYRTMHDYDANGVPKECLEPGRGGGLASTCSPPPGFNATPIPVELVASECVC